MIYKEPAIYKQGLTLDDVRNYISNSEWVNVTDRIGNVVNGNLVIRYSSILNMCSINIWGSFDYDSHVTLFKFNNDFTGSWAGPQIVCRMADDLGNYFAGMCKVRWGTNPEWNPYENEIYVENAQTCAGYCVFPINSGFNLQDYLDLH